MVADVVLDSFTPKGETVPGMLADLLMKHSDRVAVQRDASRRSILGLIQPGGLALQIHPVPFQVQNLPSTAPRGQSKAHHSGQVIGANRDKPVRLSLTQPPVTLHLAGQQANQRDAVDPLPFIARRA